MRVEQQSQQSVTLRLSRAEAARLLEGLQQRAQALGAEAAALEHALRTSGVTVLPRSEPRTEYMPPLSD